MNSSLRASEDGGFRIQDGSLESVWVAVAPQNPYTINPAPQTPNTRHRTLTPSPECHLSPCADVRLQMNSSLRASEDGGFRIQDGSLESVWVAVAPVEANLHQDTAMFLVRMLSAQEQVHPETINAQSSTRKCGCFLLRSRWVCPTP